MTKIDICKVFAISRRTCGQPKQGEYWEASHPKTLASAAMRGDRRTNNARIMPNGNVKTTKPIYKDEEIFRCLMVAILGS